MSEDNPRGTRTASSVLPPSDRPQRRARTRSSAAQSETTEDETAFVLPNGLLLHDRPPGNVSRYKHYAEGAWQAARILLYSFAGFPQLRMGGAGPAGSSTGAGSSSGAGGGDIAGGVEEGVSPSTEERGEASGSGHQYAWKNWLMRLNDHPKGVAGFRECAIYLTTKHASTLSTGFVTDVAKAVIELVLRDAEYSRIGWKTADEIPQKTPTKLTNESVLMSRIRTAHAYKPRAQEVEKSIFRAIEVLDGATLQRIAAAAPSDHHVHALVQEKRL